MSVLNLSDRVRYRALVMLLSGSLPQHLTSRPAMAEFRSAPLAVGGVRFVVKTDIAAFFQYVDHEVLGDELLAQSGEEPAVAALLHLLGGVAGRTVGIPQISTASDVLGDVYADPVRRVLARAGFDVFRYADDFRIACPSLGRALSAVERADRAARSIGLTLNERKTLTFRRINYDKSLQAFAAREAALFAGDGEGDLSLLDDSYGDGNGLGGDGTLTLGAPGADEDDEPGDLEAATVAEGAVDPRLANAATRAFRLWEVEDEGADVQSTQDAAITQSLLARALPVLGAAGDEEPLDALGAMLAREPSLTPHIAAYLVAVAVSGKGAARSARDALNDVTSGDLVSPWQAMWLAHAAGGLPRRKGGNWPGKHISWLEDRVADGPPGLAATAGMALGRRGEGDPRVLAGSLDRVGEAWRPLLFLGLALLDIATAEAVADGALDRVLLRHAAKSPPPPSSRRGRLKPRRGCSCAPSAATELRPTSLPEYFFRADSAVPAWTPHRNVRKRRSFGS